MEVARHGDTAPAGSPPTVTLPLHRREVELLLHHPPELNSRRYNSSLTILEKSPYLSPLERLQLTSIAHHGSQVLRWRQLQDVSDPSMCPRAGRAR